MRRRTVPSSTAATRCTLLYVPTGTAVPTTGNAYTTTTRARRRADEPRAPTGYRAAQASPLAARRRSERRVGACTRPKTEDKQTRRGGDGGGDVFTTNWRRAVVVLARVAFSIFRLPSTERVCIQDVPESGTHKTRNRCASRPMAYLHVAHVTVALYCATTTPFSRWLSRRACYCDVTFVT